MVAQMRSRGNKSIPWRGSRETACSNLFVFITSVKRRGFLCKMLATFNRKFQDIVCGFKLTFYFFELLEASEFLW